MIKKIANFLARMTKMTTCLCIIVQWKVELLRMKLNYLADAISKQCAEPAVWLLLNANTKMPSRQIKIELLFKW